MKKMLENLNLMKENYMNKILTGIALGTFTVASGCFSGGVTGNYKTLDEAVNAKEAQLSQMAEDGINLGDYKKIQDELSGKGNALVNQPVSYGFELILPENIKKGQEGKYQEQIDNKKLNFKRVKLAYDKTQKQYVDKLIEISDTALEIGGKPLIRFGIGAALKDFNNKIKNAYISKQQPSVFLDEVEGLKDKSLYQIKEDLGDDLFYASLAQIATGYFTSGKVKHTETPLEFHKAWMGINQETAINLLGKDTKAFYKMTMGQLTDGENFNWELYHPSGVAIQPVLNSNVADFNYKAQQKQQ